MSQLIQEDFEVVGIDGSMVGVCGRASVVVRNKHSDNYFKLHLGDGEMQGGVGYSRSEIEEFEEEGRLTLFPNPSPVFGNVMAVYVREEFVKAFDATTPGDFCREFAWQEVKSAGRIWVSLASASDVERTMNEWASMLETRCDELITESLSTRRKGTIQIAERFASLALYAARDPKLRADLYVSYGSAILLSTTHKRLKNLHTYVLREQFPTWSWDDFRSSIRERLDILRDKATALSGSIHQGASRLMGAWEMNPSTYNEKSVGKLSRRVSSDTTIVVYYVTNIYKKVSRVEKESEEQRLHAVQRVLN